LPPGLGFNTNTGLISGTPTLAGEYQTFLTASNAAGTGASTVDITIFNNSNSVVREVWTNVPASTFPISRLTRPANSVAAYGALQGITDFGDKLRRTPARIYNHPDHRNYYFWISGSDSAHCGFPTTASRRTKSFAAL